MKKIIIKKAKKVEWHHLTNGDLTNILLYSNGVSKRCLKFLLNYFDVINNDSIKRLINTELNNYNNTNLFNRIELLESLL